MFQVFVFLVLPFWTSANSYNGDKNVQKQVKTLQNTVNELKDLVHVQMQRNDFLELEIVKTRNEMKQMKEIHLNEIRNLNSRVSNWELIKAKYNRVFKTLKRNYTDVKKYVNPLNSRLWRLEKIHTAMMEEIFLMPTQVWIKKNQKTGIGTSTEFRVRKSNLFFKLSSCMV